jgi:hypothetical protein
MAGTWEMTFKGGAFDGAVWVVGLEPGEGWPPVVVAWTCHGFCDGHVATPDNPMIVLEKAVAYTFDSFDEGAGRATYVLGDPTGGEDEREVEELVGAGVGFSGFDRAADERHRTGWPT